MRTDLKLILILTSISTDLTLMLPSICTDLTLILASILWLSEDEGKDRPMLGDSNLNIKYVSSPVCQYETLVFLPYSNGQRHAQHCISHYHKPRGDLKISGHMLCFLQ